MIAGNNDNKNTELDSNPMDEESNTEFLFNSTLFPSLEVKASNH